MLSKEASSTMFWVFRMTRIELRSPGPLANTDTLSHNNTLILSSEYFSYIQWFVLFGFWFFGLLSSLYCSKLKHNFSAAVSSGLPRMSLVYLGIEMIQAGKSFLKFDCDFPDKLGTPEEGRSIPYLPNPSARAGYNTRSIF